MRAYFAQTGQPFLQFQASSSLPFTISSPGTPGTPPNRVTAFYPDSDGNFISAYTMFRWLNEALTTASYVAGGIPDTSGVQMNLNQGMYVMPGIWDKFESCWFDGFPIAFDKRQGMFYRNVLQGIVFVASLQMSSDRQVLEFQPQPDRSGGQTTLSAQVLLPDQTINVTSTASFGPNLGMFSIGAPGASYPNVEICSYGYMSGSQLIGVQRGLGGTAQQAWPNGSQVTELNFRFGGLRIANTTPYVPGMSLATLQVPPGWSRPLIDYLVCKAREGEQSPQESARKLQEFTTFIKGYTTGNKQIAGPRQIGPPNRSGDAYPSASSGGGLIIP
jgi:hypothetical protein